MGLGLGLGSGGLGSGLGVRVGGQGHLAEGGGVLRADDQRVVGRATLLRTEPRDHTPPHGVGGARCEGSTQGRTMSETRR